MINSRLKADLIHSSQYGRNPLCTVSSYQQLSPDNGVSRIAGSLENKKIRDYAVQCMQECGLQISIDSFGNIFGRKEGLFKNIGSVMFGSHLDSVINGGQFDGALGVFTAIDAIRRLNKESFSNKRPLEIVIFTGEEGSAFGTTLLGSSAFTGYLPVEEVLQMKNKEGKTFKDTMQEIGYYGIEKKDLGDIAYFIELHIEQGPILYQEKIPIGIVESITGLLWMYITITGEPNHAGTTPMNLRKDALLAASSIIQFLNKEAKKLVDNKGSSTVATVGKLDISPNGINIIPGKVKIGVDIRDKKEDNIHLLKEKMLEKIKQLIEDLKLNIEYDIAISIPPQPLSAEVMESIKVSAEKLGYKYKFINSGATHDAQNMARITKTGMIFLPSINGISHSPLEWTDWEDIEKGAQVLTETLKILAGK